MSITPIASILPNSVKHSPFYYSHPACPPPSPSHSETALASTPDRIIPKETERPPAISSPAAHCIKHAKPSFFPEYTREMCVLRYVSLSEHSRWTGRLILGLERIGMHRGKQKRRKKNKREKRKKKIKRENQRGKTDRGELYFKKWWKISKTGEERNDEGHKESCKWPRFTFLSSKSAKCASALTGAETVCSRAPSSYWRWRWPRPNWRKGSLSLRRRRRGTVP